MCEETRKCKQCGADASFVAGMSVMERRLEQFHCPQCHFTFICEHNGKFVREGVLPEPLEYYYGK